MDTPNKAHVVLLALCVLIQGSMAIRISFLTLHEVLVKVDTDRNPSRSGVDKFAMCQEPRHSRLRVDTLEELRFISEQLKETALSCVQSQRKARCLTIDNGTINSLSPRKDCVNSTWEYEVRVDNSGIKEVDTEDHSNEIFDSATHGTMEDPAKVNWFLFWIQESDSVYKGGLQNCLVYDFETEKATTSYCLPELKLDAIVCQKDKEEEPNLILIIGSIGLASLVLQLLMVIGCIFFCCRRRARSEDRDRAAKVAKTSDVARNIRLQSLTSEGTTSYSQHYDHISTNHLNNHSPSLPNSSLFQYDQLNVYNEIPAESEKGRQTPSPNPYAEPYTDFVPGSPNLDVKGRTLPPVVAPPCVPKVQTGSKGVKGPYDEPLAGQSKEPGKLEDSSATSPDDEELAALVPPPSENSSGDVYRGKGESGEKMTGPYGVTALPENMVENDGYGR